MFVHVSTWILINYLTFLKESCAFLPTEDYLKGKGEIKEDWCTDYFVFRTFTDATLYECADECMRRTRCSSILYHSNMKFCRLRTQAVIPSSIAGLHRLCLSSNIMSWDFASIGSCATRPCGTQYRCESYLGSFNCVITECLNPLLLSDSTIGSSTTKAGLKNRYFCLPEYTIVGNPVITCSDNGVWTSSDFTCKRRCDISATLNNARFICDPPKVFLVNDSVEYKCANGFSRDVGYEDEKLFCNSDGSWTQPHCIQTCQEPVIENGGKYASSSDPSPYTEGDRFVVQCNVGYSPQDATSSTFANTMRCIGGRWSLNIVCVPNI